MAYRGKSKKGDHSMFMRTASKTKQIKQTQPKASKRSKVKQIKLIMNLNLYLIMILIVIVRGLRPLPARA